jgi:DNA gyrase subunit A
MQIVPGPDFPTGATILGRSGIRSAYTTGRGSVVMRARATIEEIRKDREAIIVTEIPYQVNKATLIERIAELVREKKVEGISDLRDESDRKGMRIVIELKRDAMGDVVLNQLYRHTALQSTFGCNMIALNGGRRPEMMTLKDMLTAFIDFREEVIGRRTRFRLNKARDRAHVLVGLAIAVANIDEVIALIRRSPDAATAREALMARDWPAQDVAPLIALIDDPRHSLSSRWHLSPVRAAGPGHSRSAPATPDRAGPRRNRRGTGEDRGGNPRFPRYPVVARPHFQHHQGRTGRRPRRMPPRASPKFSMPTAISRTRI